MSKTRDIQTPRAPVRLNRRDFMQHSAGLALAAGVGGGLNPLAALAATPRRGGVLRIGAGGGSTTDVLDPALVTDVMAPVVTVGQTRNCLIETDASGRLTGELAESWEASADAKTWRFLVRDGVEFHNGKTMNVADVVYSINHHRKPDSKSVVNGLVSQISEVATDGRYVVMTLADGNADFAYLMSDPHFQVVPDGTTDFSDGMGTGGYVLKSWDPGVRALSVRNPNYWKSGRAHFDEVETIGISDVVARMSAVQAGDVDVINRVSRSTARRLAQVEGVELVIQNGLKHYTLPMRVDVAPFDNNDVRLAIKYAVDREELIQKVLSGYGVLGNDHPIGPANRYYAAELPQRALDPDKARFHLRKAGLDKLDVKLHTSDGAFEGAVDAAVLYAEHANGTGVNIEVVREPADGYWSNVWRNKSWCASYWSGRPTEDWMFSEAYSAGAEWNETFWAHDGFNTLLKAARSELDETKRREMYVEMQRLCSDEGGAVIPMFAADLHAASSKLAHDQPDATWELDGYRVAERWWFA